MRGWIISGFVLAAFAGLGFSIYAGTAQAVLSRPQRKSGVYCVKTQTDLYIYAERIQPNGDLKFGLSLWEGQQNISLFGVAHRRGQGWEYTDQMNAAKANDRCRLTITLDTSGARRLSADPNAKCEGDRGGYGTTLGVVQFPQKAYKGPVKSELDSPEDFEDITRC